MYNTGKKFWPVLYLLYGTVEDNLLSNTGNEILCIVKIGAW